MFLWNPFSVNLQKQFRTWTNQAKTRIPWAPMNQRHCCLNPWKENYLCLQSWSEKMQFFEICRALMLAEVAGKEKTYQVDNRVVHVQFSFFIRNLHSRTWSWYLVMIVSLIHRVVYCRCKRLGDSNLRKWSYCAEVRRRRNRWKNSRIFDRKNWWSYGKARSYHTGKKGEVFKSNGWTCRYMCNDTSISVLKFSKITWLKLLNKHELCRENMPRNHVRSTAKNPTHSYT